MYVQTIENAPAKEVSLPKFRWSHEFTDQERCGNVDNYRALSIKTVRSEAYEATKASNE